MQSYAQTFALQVKNDQITYLNDDRGNRILDFSTCGYKSSEQDIPSVRNVVFVPWKAGDNTARIQRAIDYVASLAPDASGFRGAVLLDQGEFSLSGSIRISAPGIVLRGTDKEKTCLSGDTIWYSRIFSNLKDWNEDLQELKKPPPEYMNRQQTVIQMM